MCISKFYILAIIVNIFIANVFLNESIKLHTFVALTASPKIRIFTADNEEDHVKTFDRKDKRYRYKK